MRTAKELALEVFPNQKEKPCLCHGQHEICLHCRVCRSQDNPQLPTDFENLAQYIDHTALKPETTAGDIDKLCHEAEELKVKAVCVNPVYVRQVRKNLKHVFTCSVVGFPLAASKKDVILEETRHALEDGAAEIDMVIKVNYLKDKRYTETEEEIAEITHLVHSYGAIIKVIHENCLLTEEEKVIACLLSKHAGADFVKTSTGFNTSGATAVDVELMRKVMGPNYGVKAAGGIRTREQAIEMLKAGANRIGASKTVDIV